MRETIGNTFIIKLVIVFTLLFSAFLALAISYNKVFRMKNEVLSIIEKYDFDVMLTVSTSPLRYYLEKCSDWKIYYSDDMNYIFVKA